MALPKWHFPIRQFKKAHFLKYKIFDIGTNTFLNLAFFIFRNVFLLRFPETENSSTKVELRVTGKNDQLMSKSAL